MTMPDNNIIEAITDIVPGTGAAAG